MKTSAFSFSTAAKLSVIFGAMLLTLAAVNYFSFYPILQSVEEQERFGEPFLSNSGESITLVVDTTMIRALGKSGSFSQTDWSYGWINLLLQEARRYDVIDISALNSAGDINHGKIWIFTRSAISGDTDQQVKTFLDKLEQSNVEEAVVYLEAPDTLAAGNEVIQQLIGAGYHARHYSRLTQTPLAEFNLSCDGLAAVTAPSGFQPMLKFNDTPVLWQGQRKGIRLLLGVFNFGELAVTIQQGRPNDDFSVTPRITKRTGLLPIVSSDLCADSSYYMQLTPFFDNFEHLLFEIIFGAPSYAPLFAGSPDGAFIMSHDEEGMGDKSAWMARQERLWGVTSATLVTPAAITSKGIEEILKAGGELALHTDQYSYFKRPGLPGLRPIKKNHSLADQKRSLEQLAPRGLVDSLSSSINRNHWLIWSGNYTGMMRKLAGAGINLDLTYGPIGEGIAGYLFGTCFPFVPLDTNGFPLPILELPFLFQDDEDFAAEYLDSIFDTSSFQNEIVNVVFHTNTMGHSPDTLLLWGWRESFKRAKNANLPILHYSDIVDSLRAQRATMPADILNQN